MKKQRTYLTFTVITISILLIVAMAAGAGLWMLHSKCDDIARLFATNSVMNRGEKLVQYLSQHPAITAEPSDSAAWKTFSELFDNLYSADESLQYVSVTRDGLTLFNRHSRGVANGTEPPMPPTPSAPVTVAQKIISVAGKPTPLFAFAESLAGANGNTLVEVALRRDAIDEEENHVTRAVDALFKSTLYLFALSFGVCILVAVWMIRREALSEKRRRQEEHLVFSGVLADGIVHDFRNPMSSMQLDIQMLGREALKPAPASERITELTQRLMATMDRLDLTFQEFFHLSKPSDDSPTEVNLVDCLQECIDIVAPTLEQANIMVQMNVPQTPLRVMADNAALRRAVINVITNAKQFSDRGDAIHITLEQRGAKALIAIEDNGPGIPKQNRERIFEMFVTNRPGGTGLGLFLARTALEGMKGTIRVVDPVSGKGSRLEISLPLLKI